MACLRLSRASPLLVCSVMLLSTFQLHAALIIGQDRSSSRIASLRTIVFDPAGAIIPNAEVVFRGEKTVAGKTAQDGSIRVQVPYGEYSLTVSMPGFTTSVEHVSIQTAEPPELEIVLQLAFTPCDPCLDVPGIEPQTSVLTNMIEEDGETNARQTRSVSSICTLQKTVAPGTHVHVRVSGVYGPSLDKTVLADAACPKASTWVELALQSQKNEEKLRKLLDRSRQARVVVAGEFYGPPLPDPNLPEAVKKEYHPGWGHLAAFPTKMVVHRIESVSTARDKP